VNTDSDDDHAVKNKSDSDKKALDNDKVTLTERSVRIYQSFKDKKDNKRKSSKKK
jgi:glycogen operon protein